MVAAGSRTRPESGRQSSSASAKSASMTGTAVTGKSTTAAGGGSGEGAKKKRRTATGRHDGQKAGAYNAQSATSPNVTLASFAKLGKPSNTVEPRFTSIPIFSTLQTKNCSSGFLKSEQSWLDKVEGLARKRRKQLEKARERLKSPENPTANGQRMSAENQQLALLQKLLHDQKPRKTDVKKLAEQEKAEDSDTSVDDTLPNVCYLTFATSWAISLY